MPGSWNRRPICSGPSLQADETEPPRAGHSLRCPRVWADDPRSLVGVGHWHRPAALLQMLVLFAATKLPLQALFGAASVVVSVVGSGRAQEVLD